MDPRIKLASVTDQAISPPELLALVSTPTAGAVTIFVGQVRNHDPEADCEVVALDYTCHPTAPQLLPAIITAALSQTDADEQTLVAVAHRIGHLEIGDPAFVVSVSAPHRDRAFEVCREVVERVKRELPIWKQQFTADGAHGWPGLGG